MAKRFTIRAVLVATAVLAVLVAFYSNSLRGYRNEQQAFEELRHYVFQSPCYMWSSGFTSLPISAEVSSQLPTPLAALSNRFNVVAFNRVEKLHVDNVVEAGIFARLDSFRHLRELRVFAIDPASFSNFCEAAQAYRLRNPGIRYVVGDEPFDPLHPSSPRVPRRHRHPLEWIKLHNPLVPREPTPLQHDRSRLRSDYDWRTP